MRDQISLPVITRWLVQPLLCAALIDVRAATITVTNTADNGPGSLRWALASATNGDIVDATGVSGTIALTSGKLLIANSLTINGPGPSNLAIDGNFPNTLNSVFQVTNGVTAGISGLTITNGHSDWGGGIDLGGAALTVSNCTITGNFAVQRGGGIAVRPYNPSPALTVVNCVINGNSAEIGGGILSMAFHSDPVTVIVVGSTISTNSATNGGGGIANIVAQASSTLILINSTLAGNSAGTNGGGIGFSGSIPYGSLSLTNTTLSGNTSSSEGGGVWIGTFFSTFPVTLVSCTLSGNSAPTGGGIWSDTFVKIGNTLLNAGSSGSNIDGAVTSLGYNLSSDDGGGFLTDPTDQINTNPILGPLQDNGGPAATHALLSGSPAIDKGKNLGAVTSDERGVPRIYDDATIANAPGGDGTDIGAYESSLFITAVEKVGDDLRLSFTSPLGMSYELQTLSELGAGGWHSVPGIFQGNGSVAQATSSNAFTQPQQFYRIHQLP